VLFIPQGPILELIIDFIIGLPPTKIRIGEVANAILVTINRYIKFLGYFTVIIMLRNAGNGYKAYIFGESTRRYAIDRKGQGRKEVIYPRVADISYTQGIHKSTGFSYRGPYSWVP